MTILRFLAITVLISSAAQARDYFLSARGNDSGGCTRSAPCRSLDKLNATDFEPGDRILFEGGQTFEGTLRLDANDGGASGKPVVIESYGSDRAAIDGATGSAIVLEGAAHVTVRNLILRGAGRKTGNTGSGLLMKGAANVEVERIDAAGFRHAGIHMDGVSDVRIKNVRAHQNGFSGISAGGGWSRNIYIGHSLTENNPGDPTVRKNHSGNGIVVGHVKGALVEYNESRYNGWDMPWTGNGPVGIWTYQSDRVVIQFNVAHHNRSTGADGGGFDLDGGATNALVQYNYSHSNFGSGYLICQYEGAGVFADNIVRYNISQDDGMKDHDAGIFVWVGGANMKSTTVHNNTVFNTRGAAVAFGFSPKYAEPAPVFRFHNNIFVSQGPQIRGGAKNGIFQGNLYWSMGERGFNVDGFKNFDEWVKATGQETLDGRVVGVFGDPMLRKDGNGLLTDPDKLASLLEYQVLPGSAAIDAGLDLRAKFGLDPGKRDYFGGPVPVGGRFDIGAHEFGGAVQTLRTGLPARR
jgi:hypothetical protein